jgi:multidrug efflux pump subunit AcrA (membrane-fusion protein)
MERYDIDELGCMSPRADGDYVLYDDAQRALDAEREKVKRLSTCGTDHSTPWWQVKCEDLEAQLATLQAQLAAEQHRADRAVQDRRDALDVKTKEGMSCSEWLMRTATAERQVNELKAQLWQVEEALDEALGALGYPVPADTPSPGRYKCGLCEAATLAAKDAGKAVGNGNS